MKSFTRQEKVLLALMAAIQFSHIVDFMIMMPLGDMLMKLFQITPQQFGLLVSSYTLSAGISGFAASFFIDRFDRKSALLFFTTGFSAGTLACAFAPTYPALLMTRSLTGVFGGVLGSLVLSIVSDTFTYERRGSAMGIVMGALSLASIFGVPFSLQLADVFSWHAPFVFLGLVGAMVTALVAIMLPSMKDHLTKHAPHSRLDSIANILRSPNQRIALFFMSCLMLGQFSIIPFLSPSLVSNAGMRQGQLSLVYLFGGACSMIASPLAGRLADRYGKHMVFTVGALASTIPIFLITHMHQTPIWIILAVCCLFFVSLSSRMVPAMAMISSTTSPEYRGSFLSVSSAVQQLSSAAAAYAAGLIVSRGANGELMQYEIVGYVAIGCSLLAIAAASRLRTDDAKPA